MRRLLLSFIVLSAACGGAANNSQNPDGGMPLTGLAENAQHCLDTLNMYRAQNSAAPLVLDDTLSAFALAGSQELEQDNLPHKHFMDASSSGAIWTSGFCHSAGENQAPGWPAADVDATIDAILKAMMDEGPGGGHHDNIVSTDFTRVGVGLVVDSGSLWFTNDFSAACP